MDNYEIAPHDGFLVTNVNYFSDFSQKILTDLYLPIIGSNAYAVYLFLWQMNDQAKISIDRIEYIRIINSTGIGIDQIKDSLHKLEGIGLIRTYFKKDIIGRLFLYELFSPVSPNLFFSDELLSLYLKETVGDKVFRQIQNKYILHPANKDKFQEITSSFFKVYQFNPTKLEKNKTNLNYQNTNIPDHNFDIKLFTDILRKYSIESSVLIQNINLFKELALFYQMNELEFANSLINSSSIKNDKFNKDRLINFINNKDKKVRKSNVEKNNNLSKKLNEKELEIVKLAKAKVPLAFLRSMKEQFGGFITNSEISILQSLIHRQILSDEVINILLYYEVKNFPTIVRTRTDTIANDWSRHNINTADEAFIYLKDFQEKRKQKGKSNIISKKPIPSWFDDNDEVNDNNENKSMNKLIEQEEKRRKELEDRK